MIKQLHINQYRKMKNLDLEFTPCLNAISGTNGTCKTSLLHLFSNSFQAVTSKCSWLTNTKCLQIINAVNAITNPKVESLTRGDQKYNDPAHGMRGVLFTVDYFDREPLGFRRHNSQINSRYAVKPMYSPGSSEKLPYCPVIYLGLSRLVPFGEYQNDEAVSNIKLNLPNEYQQEISDIYKKFTNYSISATNAQKMGDIKIRAEFSSDYEGIDSNTISAGEDNLHIILTALVSLKYYYQSISSSKTVESVLLIDELDATLHYKVFINFDPPYVQKGGQLYMNYFTEEDHRKLRDAIAKCSRKWMVTYDVCDLTASLYGSFVEVILMLLIVRIEPESPKNTYFLAIISSYRPIRFCYRK